MNEDTLDLELGTQFSGIEQAKQYARALTSVARAEEKAAQAILKANEAMKSMPPPPPPPAGGGGGQGQKGRLPSGPNQRLLKAGEDFEKAKAEGDVAQIADAHYALRRAQAAQEAAMRGSLSPAAQALYSTRLNLPGGAAPLVGKTLEAALGKEKALAVVESFATKIAPALPLLGVFGAVVKAGMHVSQELYAMADASAKATNALTDAQAQSGGSIAEVSRTRLIGADNNKARAFNDRIATDPLAMAAAGRVGVANLKAPYGNLNFAQTYLASIERVSKIGDESLRRRLSVTLGIEEEVARYSLLSESTRSALADTARQTGMVNDPLAQRKAAEFRAAQDRLGQSWENLKGAGSQLFEGDIAALLDNTASVFGWLSTTVKRWEKQIRFATLLRTAGPLVAISDLFTGGGNPPANANTSALDANTQSNIELTQSIQYLNKNIGQSARAREATDRFRTFGSATQFSIEAQRQFAFGALG